MRCCWESSALSRALALGVLNLSDFISRLNYCDLGTFGGFSWVRLGWGQVDGHGFSGSLGRIALATVAAATVGTVSGSAYRCAGASTSKLSADGGCVVWR